MYFIGWFSRFVSRSPLFVFVFLLPIDIVFLIMAWIAIFIIFLSSLPFFPFRRIGFKRRNRSRNYCSNCRGCLEKYSLCTTSWHYYIFLLCSSLVFNAFVKEQFMIIRLYVIFLLLRLIFSFFYFIIVREILKLLFKMEISFCSLEFLLLSINY